MSTFHQAPGQNIQLGISGRTANIQLQMLILNNNFYSWVTLTDHHIRKKSSTTGASYSIGILCHSGHSKYKYSIDWIRMFEMYDFRCMIYMYVICHPKETKCTNGCLWCILSMIMCKWVIQHFMAACITCHSAHEGFINNLKRIKVLLVKWGELTTSTTNKIQSTSMKTRAENRSENKQEKLVQQTVFQIPRANFWSNI